MQRFSQEWWEENVKKSGLSYEAGSVSKWSTMCRLHSISKWIHQGHRIADAGAGVGILGTVLGPFERYVIADFSENALELAKADRKIRCDLCEEFPEFLDRCMEERIDWIVFCGYFMTPNVLNRRGAAQMMREALYASKIGVIGNFREADWPHEEYLNTHRCLDVMRELDDLKPSVDRSFMPSEFMVIVHHAKEDWHTREESAERIKRDAI